MKKLSDNWHLLCGLATALGLSLTLSGAPLSAQTPIPTTNGLKVPQVPASPGMAGTTNVGPKTGAQPPAKAPDIPEDEGDPRTQEQIPEAGLISWVFSFGQVQDRHGDWLVTRENEGNCFALTEAYGVTPTDVHIWDGIPVFSVRYAPGEAAVAMSMLYRGGEQTGTASIAVLQRGTWQDIDSRFDDSWLKPLGSDSDELANAALRAFTHGLDARVSGTFADTDFQFLYSLRGYSAANRAANLLCNAKADWTVR